MKKTYLLTPGPSPVPPQVREVLGKEIIHHRTDEYQKVLHHVHAGLKDIFCTKNPVVVFSSSGTGAMEAAVSNILSSGDTIIVITGGKFGERWKEIAQSFGINVIEHAIEWGSAPDPEDIRGLLHKYKEVKAVYATHCETSTATVYDIQGLGAVVKPTDAVLVVDAISSLGQDKLLTDAWGVDVVVGGSQKGFMLPPGLALLSVSEKAQKCMLGAKLPQYYFDLKRALKSFEKDDTPWTSSVSLVRGLGVSIEMILQEGMQIRWQRFAALAQRTRQAVSALGLSLFSKSPSASVTSVVSPENIKSSELVKKLRKEYGLSIAGGQAQLKNKIFRIAHMGWINQDALIVGFSFLEKALKDLGYKFREGASVEKMQEVFHGQH